MINFFDFFILGKEHRFRSTKFLSVKLYIFSYPSVLTYVSGAQKNHLIETVLLSTHNGSMTFGRKPFGRNDVWSNATFG